MSGEEDAKLSIKACSKLSIKADLQFLMSGEEENALASKCESKNEKKE